MEQINTERQQTIGRLVRQLPANLNEQTISPTHQKHVKKNTTKSANHSKKITDLEHSKALIQHRRTDQGDFDTNRSLSTCPTYSSLSRQSHETRVSEYVITSQTSIRSSTSILIIVRTKCE